MFHKWPRTLRGRRKGVVGFFTNYSLNDTLNKSILDCYLESCDKGKVASGEKIQCIVPAPLYCFLSGLSKKGAWGA